jgi:hypothetical protein
VIFPIADDFQNRSRLNRDPAKKKLYVIVSMDFHPFLPDDDTIFERFDENAMFKEWRRPKIP